MIIPFDLIIEDHRKWVDIEAITLPKNAEIEISHEIFNSVTGSLISKGFPFCLQPSKKRMTNHTIGYGVDLLSKAAQFNKHSTAV